jgi:polyhydroxyalkanoate synthesis regulator phasin
VFLMGLGAATATMSAIEALTKELVKQGKVSQQEAERFARDLARRADESTKGIQGKAREQSDKAASIAGFATKSDVDRIEKDIAEIKRLLTRGAPVGDDEPYTP